MRNIKPQSRWTHPSPLLTSRRPLGRGRSELSSIPPSPNNPPPKGTRLSSRSGFTLIEVLVVAVIVVLMLGMALPVFHAITGSRSEAGASNLITAMLSRSRSDAIGLQKNVGVAFIYNSSKQSQGMAEVEFPDCSAWLSQINYPMGSYCSSTAGSITRYYYCFLTQSSTGTGTTPPGTNWYEVGGPPIELRQDTDVIPLPMGVGVQTVCNCSVNASNNTRNSDGYLSCGVILFDSQGRLTAQNYGISQYSKLALASGLVDPNNTATSLDYPKVNGSAGDYGVPSQFGLVVFQLEPFLALGPPPIPTDSYYTGTTYGGLNKIEEDWLDTNATPLVLDRYTGTLIKSE